VTVRINSVSSWALLQRLLETNIKVEKGMEAAVSMGDGYGKHLKGRKA
jgi:hypothetical protein